MEKEARAIIIIRCVAYSTAVWPLACISHTQENGLSALFSLTSSLRVMEKARTTACRRRHLEFFDITGIYIKHIPLALL